MCIPINHNIIHLLTGYEGNSTFIVPKVPTIFKAPLRKIFGTEGTIKVLLPDINFIAIKILFP
jgi:hypothetical protein